MTKGQIDDIVKTQVLPGSTIFTNKISAFPKLHRYKANIAAERFVIEKFYCIRKGRVEKEIGEGTLMRQRAGYILLRTNSEGTPTHFPFFFFFSREHPCALC